MKDNYLQNEADLHQVQKRGKKYEEKVIICLYMIDRTKLLDLENAYNFIRW